MDGHCHPRTHSPEGSPAQRNTTINATQASRRVGESRVRPTHQFRVGLLFVQDHDDFIHCSSRRATHHPALRAQHSASRSDSVFAGWAKRAAWSAVARKVRAHLWATSAPAPRLLALCTCPRFFLIIFTSSTQHSSCSSLRNATIFTMCVQKRVKRPKSAWGHRKQAPPQIPNTTGIYASAARLYVLL